MIVIEINVILVIVVISEIDVMIEIIEHQIDIIVITMMIAELSVILRKKIKDAKNLYLKNHLHPHLLIPLNLLLHHKNRVT